MQALTSASLSSGGDVISVPAGTYQLTLGTLSIADDQNPVTMTGAGARATIIRANLDNTARVFEIDGTNVTLANLTMTGGTATDAARLLRRQHHRDPRHGRCSITSAAPAVTPPAAAASPTATARW